MSEVPLYRAVAWTFGGTRHSIYVHTCTGVSAEFHFLEMKDTHRPWGGPMLPELALPQEPKAVRVLIRQYFCTGVPRPSENAPPLGPYSRTMPRLLWRSRGGGRFLMSELPLSWCSFSLWSSCTENSGSFC